MSHYISIILTAGFCTLIWVCLVQQHNQSGRAIPLTSGLRPGQQLLPSNYKHYYVAPSTIPGAGLGLFAKTDLPAGTMWNIEDSFEGSTWNLTRDHWDNIIYLADTLQASGTNQHAVFDLITFIRRYAYYCEEADLMMVSLTHSTLTNHAFQAALSAAKSAMDSSIAHLSTAEQALPPSRRLAQAVQPNARKLASMIPADADTRYQANSGFAWEVGPQASAAQAARYGVPAPTLRDRCVLSRLQRDLKAGEEILEDYGSYNCPWPGCAHPSTSDVDQVQTRKRVSNKA